MAGLNEVVFGQTSQPSDLNQLVDILNRRAGQTETGKYGIIGNWAGAGSGFVGQYICSLSRNTAPVSVSVDTADQAPGGNLGSPSTANLTSGGFKVFATMTNGNNGFCAGNYTITY
jgi:hypothetical protein